MSLSTVSTMPTVKELVAFSESPIFAQTNFFWNTRWNNSKALGRVSQLLKLAHMEFQQHYSMERFIPFALWCRYYYERVHPMEYLYEYAMEFHRAYPGKLSEQEAFLAVICRVLYQTYLGGKAEYLAMQHLATIHPDRKQVLATDQEDRLFCVDILEYEGDDVVSAYQVKPSSFFSGIRLRKDWAKGALEYNQYGHQEFFSITGILPEYIAWEIQEKHLVFQVFSEDSI